MVYGLRLTVYMIFYGFYDVIIIIYVSMCVYMIMIDNAYIELYIYTHLHCKRKICGILKRMVYII